MRSIDSLTLDWWRSIKLKAHAWQKWSTRKENTYLIYVCRCNMTWDDDWVGNGSEKKEFCVSQFFSTTNSPFQLIRLSFHTRNHVCQCCCSAYSIWQLPFGWTIIIRFYFSIFICTHFLIFLDRNRVKKDVLLCFPLVISFLSFEYSLLSCLLIRMSITVRAKKRGRKDKSNEIHSHSRQISVSNLIFSFNFYSILH